MNKFSVLFPKISWWIDNHGWIELGQDVHSTSLVRLIDEGGIYWEDDECDELDDALINAEKFLEMDLPIRFGENYNK